jgi:hypothetical protein
MTPLSLTAAELAHVQAAAATLRASSAPPSSAMLLHWSGAACQLSTRSDCASASCRQQMNR